MHFTTMLTLLGLVKKPAEFNSIVIALATVVDDSIYEIWTKKMQQFLQSSARRILSQYYYILLYIFRYTYYYYLIYHTYTIIFI